MTQEMTPPSLSPGRQIVTKADYARLRGRSGAAVSQWIAGGKLRAPALVGEGAAQRVDVALADQQLGFGLDVGQQLAQAAPILPGIAATASVPDDDLQKRLLQNRLAQADIDLTQRQLKVKAETGQWVTRASLEIAVRREVGGLLQGIDAWLPGLAADLAAEMAIDPATLAIALRNRWRTFRADAARRRADHAAALPKLDAMPEAAA